MKVIQKLIFTVCILLLTFLVNAQYSVVKNVAVTFKIKNAGIGVDGKFSSVNASVNLDETNLSKSFFSGTIQVASVNTGIKLRDTHIKEKEEFFNVAKFPTMTMKSVSIVLKNTGVYTVTWELTIKGVTRRFTSLVNTVNSKENYVVATTEFKINRNDWGVGGKSMMMNDNVIIKLNAILSK